VLEDLGGGYLRRKHRRDRRPTLPRENPLVFYPRYAAEVVGKHLKIASLAWRLHWFTKKLDRDPSAREYSDVALTADEIVDIAHVETMNPTQLATAR
jgi:hypothetical protein